MKVSENLFELVLIAEVENNEDNGIITFQTKYSIWIICIQQTAANKSS